MILILSLMLTFGAWFITAAQTKEKVTQAFELQVEQSLNLITDRMRKYEDALWSGTAMIQVLDGDIDRNQWRTYYQNLDIEKKYPGISGIGVIHYISQSKLMPYLEQQRLLKPDYSIHPSHNKNEYLPITFIEPEPRNAKAVGLDMAHEINRYTASKKAQSTGLAQITGPIVLVQDQNKTPGFLFYAPFYHYGLKETIEERDKNFAGMVYAPFIVKKLMEGTLLQQNRHVGIRISDGDTIIYDENIMDDQFYDKNAAQFKEVTQAFYGRQWTFEFRSNLLGKAFKETSQPIIILLSGLIIDALLLFLFLLLVKSNKKAIDFASRVTKDLELNNKYLENEIIEKKKLALEAKQATQAKSQFLSNMSHELRTPLNAVIGFISMCLKTKLQSNQTFILNNAKVASNTLLMLINQTLDYSKIELGNLIIENIEFDLVKSIEKINSIFLDQALQKGIAFSINIEPSFPKKIMGDELRFEQIVINLCGNAIKFTENGEISINVSFHYVDDTHLKLQLKVTDTGVGIEHDKLDKIFDSFQQIDNSSSREFGGTGLGLSISKELVELMNGSISVSSNIDQGSQFCVELEFEIINQHDVYLKSELDQKFNLNVMHESDQKSLPASVNTEKPSEVPFKDLQIMLVEDTQFNQIIAQAMLEEFGAIVTIANHGQEALDILRTNSKFDLILMDIQMPVMDGYEATKNIIEDPSLNHIPIIALTANAVLSDIEKCKQCGMVNHISKPIDEDDVKDKIKKCMKRTL
ncbi:CHASE domain-containing protein [Marinicellulosiphila megalodicopiae]|uniref:CHASE domain-containing protein n=1 Tax=Marinicellulosiphila megalodicopiae TaxID=2724896 RepID=UPI003BB1343A